QRCEGLLEALGGKRPLGLVEAHAARRGEDGRGVVDHPRPGEHVRGDLGDGPAQRRDDGGAAAQHLPQSVAEHLLLPELGGAGAGSRRMVRTVARRVRGNQKNSWWSAREDSARKERAVASSGSVLSISSRR